MPLREKMGQNWRENCANLHMPLCDISVRNRADGMKPSALNFIVKAILCNLSNFYHTIFSILAWCNAKFFFKGGVEL